MRAVPNPKTLVAVAVAAAVIAAGCAGSDDDGAVADETIAPVSDSTQPSTADTTVPPATDPPSTVPVEASPIREGMTLTAGWTYVAEGFDIPLEYTIPADRDDGRWRVLLANTWSTVNVLGVTARNPDVGDAQPPGMAFTTVPEGVTVDDFVARLDSYAAENDHFTFTQEVGEFRGAEVTVLRGSSNSTANGTFSVPVSDENTLPMPTGPVEFLMYLVPIDERLLAVTLAGHELDFDLIVTNAAPIIESISVL